MSDNSWNPNDETINRTLKELSADAGQPLVEEAAPVYRANPEQYILNLGRRLGKRQGQFTISDRESLPDDIRTELIDGVIYLMASPTSRHQIVAGQIYHQLCNYIYSQDGPCTPFIAPSDVKLDEDEKTVVQPDVYVICKKDKKDKEKRQIENKDNGGKTDSRPSEGWPGCKDDIPVFVVEVLSPSTRNKDMFLKTTKYFQAGVREYWIVDPEKEKVIVHRFGGEPETGIYGFDGSIPAGICGGACRIDFPQIRKRVDRYFR